MYLEKIKDFAAAHRQLVIGMGVITGVVFLVVASVIFFLAGFKEPVAVAPLAAPEKSSAVRPVSETALADIKGAVNKPGVYEVTSNDRIVDLVKKAGGFSATADDSKINLAQHVTDQLVVYVPEIGEAWPEEVTPTSLSPAASGNQEDDSKININTADQAKLKELAGIGEKKAQEIINYREKHGPYQTIEAITEVSGIGEKTLENIQDMITIK
jgi:competence protein ComEA